MPRHEDAPPAGEPAGGAGKLGVSLPEGHYGHRVAIDLGRIDLRLRPIAVALRSPLYGEWFDQIGSGHSRRVDRGHHWSLDRPSRAFLQLTE